MKIVQILQFRKRSDIWFRISQNSKYAKKRHVYSSPEGLSNLYFQKGFVIFEITKGAPHYYYGNVCDL